MALTIIPEFKRQGTIDPLTKHTHKKAENTGNVADVVHIWAKVQGASDAIAYKNITVTTTKLQIVPYPLLQSDPKLFAITISSISKTVPSKDHKKLKPQQNKRIQRCYRLFHLLK